MGDGGGRGRGGRDKRWEVEGGSRGDREICWKGGGEGREQSLEGDRKPGGKGQRQGEMVGGGTDLYFYTFTYLHIH